ncbi:hydroxyisourate hydrolase [Terrilactibacillus sp. BCM23-1]|uniref:5-hydroxyisourate hydrolase n=1 Tax=Terrilactibacillus tamarindi TaxID=2599694 RepID=A0A6N8CLM0_9BACI|nr:hydroxyisourate hydrolase [Terrilactibacillus tamarindi]MTT30849.1 hydroxyisourate hydrolase [Terrilactibacillus tamarindi]
MAGLTTHILDLANGVPAAHVEVDIRLADNKDILKTVKTNENGRVDEPLLSENELKSETYELLFHIGDYFKRQNIPLEEPAFLDVISVRVGISNPNAHYHVPLLVTPWSYQVYRGS